MVADIAPELWEKINREFERRYAAAKLYGNPIGDTLAKLEDKTAGFRDADLYAVEVGNIWSEVLKENLQLQDLPDQKLYWNIAERTIGPALQQEYGLVAGVVAEIQDEMNQAAGINIKALTPDGDQWAMKQIMNRAADADTQEKLNAALEQPVIGYSQKAADDTKVANASFLDKAGMEVKVTRIYDHIGVHNRADDCEWCLERCGTDVPYEKAYAKGMFQRHNGCRCIIEYTNKKGEKTYSGSLKDSFGLKEKDAKELEYQALKRKRDNDIIKTRGMAYGQRSPVGHLLTPKEVKEVYKAAEELGIPAKMLRINSGPRTGYSDLYNVIYIRGDILPDLNSSMANDRMSIKAVLAHEYYGHKAFYPSKYEEGDWRDEFRASYVAALKAPNLSEAERADLIIDAYDRARNAGFYYEYSKAAKEILYGRIQ